VLAPQGVAIIGASNDPEKRGLQAINSMQQSGFEGAIYPINPRQEEIGGLRCYPSISEVSGKADLALIVTPGPTIPGLLSECGEAGVRAAGIVANGFAEMGSDGAALQEQASRSAELASVRFVGPNTNGVLCGASGLNLIGASDVPLGDIAVLSQSGNVFLSLVVEATALDSVGFSFYVGVGNEVDLGFPEFLEHAAADSETRAVVVYAEGIGDPRRFLEVLKETTRAKPVVILKGGRSRSGQEAALSHSASIAGSPEVWDAAFRQAGAVVVERLDELLPVAIAARTSPAITGRRIAVVADGGGHGTLSADALERAGLELGRFSDGTRTALEEILPSAASTRNPIDVAGASDRDPMLLAEVTRLVAADPGIDGILSVGILGGYGERFAASLTSEEVETARRMAAVQAESSKPVVVQSAYAPISTEPIVAMRESGLPVFESIEIAGSALSALAQIGPAREAEGGPTVDENVDARPGEGEERLLSEPAARRLLEEAGIDCGEWISLGVDERNEQLASFPMPVAVKLVSETIAHKSDVGGVRLGVESSDGVRRAAEEISAAVAAHPDGDVSAIDGFLVAPMATEGVELFVGVSHHDGLGAVLTVGLGGRLVEVVGGHAHRVLPIDQSEAREMLTEFQGAEVLDGWRGIPAADKAGLARLLCRISDLAVDNPGIVEIDLNPTIVSGPDISLVDVRVVAVGERGVRE